MRLVKDIRHAWKQVSNHWQDYFGIMLVMQGINTIIAIPFLSYLFFSFLSKTGVKSLTNENMLGILKSPLILFIAVLFLLLFSLFIFYELGLYFLIADAHSQNKKIKLLEIMKRLNKKAKYFLSVYSLFFVAYFLLLVPVVSIGLDTELTSMIKIPDFIVDEVLLTPAGAIFYTVVIIILSYIALRLIYLIYFFVIEEKLTIWESIKKSWDFSKGKSLYNLLLLVTIGAIFAAVFAVFSFLAFVPLLIVEKIAPIAAPVFAGLALTAVQLIVFFFGSLIRPLLANGIVATVIPETKEEEKVTRKSVLTVWKRLDKRLKVGLGLVLIVVIVANIYTTIGVVYAPQTTIVAHRGFMEKSVENSLSGLAASKKAGADMMELDIQETVDQQFVVMHDYNLKRLAGKNKQVADLTLAELQEITIKQNKFEDRIPSLEEFIAKALELEIDLLIEVKPHGHESPEMVENLVKLLRETKVNDKFLVQSLDVEVLDELKSLAPEIQTGYVIPLNIGHLPDSLHDVYVLEEFSITEGLLAEAKELDKKVFVWTINQDDLLKKYLRLDVDGIITNHPDRGIALRDDNDITESFINRVKYLLE